MPKLTMVGRFFFVTEESDKMMEEMLPTLQQHSKQWNKIAILRKALERLDHELIVYDDNTLFTVPDPDVLVDIKRRDKLKAQATKLRLSMVDVAEACIKQLYDNFNWIMNTKPRRLTRTSCFKYL